MRKEAGEIMGEVGGRGREWEGGMRL